MKKVAGALLVGALVLATASPAPASKPAAQRQKEIDNRIGSLRAQMAEVSAEEHALLGELDTSAERLDVLAGKVSGLDAKIQDASGAVDEAQGELDAIESRFLRAQSRLSAARSRLTAARREMRERAIAAYTGGPAVAGLAGMVVDVRDAEDLAVRSGYMRSLLEQQSAAVDRYRAYRDDMVELRTTLDAARRSALAQRNVVAGRMETLEDARNAQQQVRQEVATEHARHEALLEKARRQKAEFAREIAALKAESESIAALLRSRQSGQARQVAGRGVLAYPVSGAVTSLFGPRVHPIFGDARMHTGVDFSAGMGTPIRAAGNGVVVHAGSRGGYGLTTIIDHGGALATLYAHQSRLAVADGEQVSRGQVIGYVGSTGYSTGPHLHFEVRVAGTPVDPLGYL